MTIVDQKGCWAKRSCAPKKLLGGQVVWIKKSSRVVKKLVKAQQKCEAVEVQKGDVHVIIKISDQVGDDWR